MPVKKTLIRTLGAKISLPEYSNATGIVVPIEAIVGPQPLKTCLIHKNPQAFHPTKVKGHATILIFENQRSLQKRFQNKEGSEKPLTPPNN